MRLRAREIKATVAVVLHDTVRPVRVQTGGLTFCMDMPDLANQLADAVTELKTNPQPREEP
jgi:hypothetical protein